MWHIFDFTDRIIIRILDWEIFVFIKNSNQLRNPFLLLIGNTKILQFNAWFPYHINLIISTLWFGITPRWISTTVLNVWFTKKMLAGVTYLYPILTKGGASDSNPNITLNHWSIIIIFSLIKVINRKVLNISFISQNLSDLF